MCACIKCAPFHRPPSNSSNNTLNYALKVEAVSVKKSLRIFSTSMKIFELILCCLCMYISYISTIYMYVCVHICVIIYKTMQAYKKYFHNKLLHNLKQEKTLTFGALGAVIPFTGAFLILTMPYFMKIML